MNTRTVIIAAACAFNIGMLSWWAQPLIIHSLIEGMKLSEPQAGLVVSTEIMAIALTSLAIAPRVHRLPARSACVSGCLAAVLFHSISIFTDSYAGLLAVRLCAGIAEGIIYAVAIGVVASTVNPDRGYGIINAFNIVFASLFLVVVPGIGLSPPQVVTFSCLAAAALILAPFVRLLPESVLKSSNHSPDDINFFDGKAWCLLLAVLLWGTGINTMYPFLFFIGSQTDLEAQQIGLVLGSAGFAAFAGVLLMILIGARYGYLRPLMAGLVVNLASVITVTMVPGSVSYITGAILSLATVYFIFPYLLAMAAGMDATGRVATAVAGVNISTGGIGPVIGGYLVSGGGAEAIGYVFIGECLLAMYLIYTVIAFNPDLSK